MEAAAEARGDEEYARVTGRVTAESALMPEADLSQSAIQAEYKAQVEEIKDSEDALGQSDALPMSGEVVEPGVEVDEPCRVAVCGR